MTVRTAELLMGVITLLISIAIMFKSAELSIGWVPERGPGSGMWPFWLSTGMALASLATIVRWFMRATPESRSDEPYIAGDIFPLILVTAISILALLIMMELIGTYFAVMLFLAFYLRFIGRHGWKTVTIFVLAVPTFIYLLFEVALTKYLPKGLEPFEEAFLVLDNVRYEIQYGGNAWPITAALAAWLALSIAFGIYAERRGQDLARQVDRPGHGAQRCGGVPHRHRRWGGARFCNQDNDVLQRNGKRRAVACGRNNRGVKQGHD